MSDAQQPFKWYYLSDKQPKKHEAELQFLRAMFELSQTSSIFIIIWFA